MRYQLKQKLLSWGDDYYIRDDQGREVYFVDGKALSFGGQLSFRDLEGNELAFIRQKVFKLSPTYEIHRDGRLAAVCFSSGFPSTLFLRHPTQSAGL